VDVWSGLETEDRYLTLIAAITSTARNKPLYSHESAVALWGLPSMGQWPVEVHVTVAPSLGTRSRNRVIRHAAVVPDEDVVDCGTYYLTSLARTILDIAATSPFMHAVVMTDRALLVDRYHRADPMLTREQLESAWGTCAATASALANTRSPVICRNARRITPGVG
jgi:predicted transcriptional regulator of viral defense system